MRGGRHPATLPLFEEREMFERFTDRARRVVVLAQEEARMLNHNYIGTEHILLGLIHEGEGVAAKALEPLGISPDAVRSQVQEISGEGQQAPSGHIPFTPRAKKVLELSLREALQLGHNYIGTEQDVLGADVVVAQLQRLAQGQLEHLLGARGERDVPGGGLLALADDLLDLRTHRIKGDAERLESLGRDTLTLVDESEQDVLGPDVVVVEHPRLFLGEDDHPAGPVGESLEHQRSLEAVSYTHLTLPTKRIV